MSVLSLRNGQPWKTRYIDTSVDTSAATRSLPFLSSLLPRKVGLRDQIRPGTGKLPASDPQDCSALAIFVFVFMYMQISHHSPNWRHVSISVIIMSSLHCSLHTCPHTSSTVIQIRFVQRNASEDGTWRASPGVARACQRSVANIA